MRKRILSIILAALMLILTIPITSLAETNGTFTELQNLIDNDVDGTLKLEKDYVNSGSESQITINKNLILDLNGHVINGCYVSRIIDIENNANVSIEDSNKTVVHKFNVDERSLATLNESSGTVTINGGCITGGNASIASNNKGSGIYINSGSLAINSGNIIGNKMSTKYQSGAGIAAENGANVSINGGMVSYNSAAWEGYGGGIYLNNSILTINGGIVSHNYGNYGGGITVYDGGNLVVNDGTISNNTAGHNGAGIAIMGSSAEAIACATINGGIIEENVNTGTWIGIGGGISTDKGADLTIIGGTIRNNYANRGAGIGAWTGGDIKIYGGKITGNISTEDTTPTDCTENNYGAGIYFDTADTGYSAVTSNLTLGKSAYIIGNTNSVTDLEENVYFAKGQTITIGQGKFAPTSDMQVGITMASLGKFTTNGTADDVKYFSSDDPNYYVKFVPDGSYLEMAKGTPVAQIGNAKYLTLKEAIRAAGVVENITDTNAKTIKLLANITNEGTFNIGSEETLQNIILDLNGFTISDTTSTTSLFKINEKSKLTIDDLSEGKTGTITAEGNTTKSIRGFDVDKSTLVLNNGKISDFSLENTAGLTGAGVSVWTNGTFTMNGGEISNCTAERGGAVDNDGKFTMTGGTITNNTASKNGGGIATSVNVTIGGTANVTGNKVGENDNNLYLETGRQIILKTPASGMSVGVTMQTPGQFTTTSATSGDGQYFTSDDKAYAVAYKPDGFLKLELTYTVTFDTDGGSAIDAQEVEVGGVVTQPTNPTKEGYTFFRWLDKDGKPFVLSTPITEDITLKASWLVNTYSVKFYRCVGDETPFCFYNVSYNNTIGNVPNTTRKGYIFKGWYYNGKPFDFNTKVTCDMDVYAEWEAIAHDYKITEGAHALWLPRYEKGFLSFRSNADYSKFVSVEVDNKILDASKFIASPGSTIVKLKPEYLSTLAIGKHTLRIVSTDGYAETDFYIEDETIAPTDGGFLSEATMSTAFVGMGVVGLSAVFYVGKKKKLRK